jgi:ElaB/YqjD/DUF883 family membrane-anchored ribosome-binding protein
MKDDLRNIKDDAKDRFSGDIAELRSSFTKLRSDVMNLLSDSVGVGKSGSSAVRDQAGAAVDGLKHQLGDLQERGSESIDALGKKISENPVASALIAVGAGFILAKLFTHRR